MEAGLKVKATLLLTMTLVIAQATAGSFASAVSFSVSGARFEKSVKSLKELRTENMVIQGLDYSCGPACIATIFTYHFNDKTAEASIINYLLLTADLKKVKARKGFSLLDLKKYCQAKGYDAIGYHLDINGLVRLSQPVLVPINIRNYDHFVIVRGFKDSRVFLADPVLGKLAMRTDKFMRVWKGGIAMVVKKEGAVTANSLLALSRKDDALVQDWNMIQHMLSESILNNIYASGEFK